MARSRRPTESDPAWLRWLKQARVAIAAAGAIAAGVIGLIHLLGGPAPTRKDASVSITSARVISYGQYLGRVQEHIDADRATLQAPGVFVEFTASLSGYSGMKLPIRADLVDDTGSELAHCSASEIRESSPRQPVGWQLWIGIPRRARSYEVELLLGNGRQRDAVARSGPRTVRASPAQLRAVPRVPAVICTG